MKLSLSTAVLILSASTVSAFAPMPLQTTSTTTTSALSLFGGGGGEGGDKKPGMMDQLAMFKKAQEMAKKKNALDEELKNESFSGESDDGKVKAAIKYEPVTNPMDPNPDYNCVSFEFDDDFFESASSEELSEAVKTCIMNGVETTNAAVAEKYSVLQADLMEAFGQQQ